METMIKDVAEEVKMAYADCWIDNWEKAKGLRNLNFRASKAVSRDEAMVILEYSKVYYNDFEPSLLKHFSEDCMITIAREASVCLYVEGSILPSAHVVKADECHGEGYSTRYWWD
jgi:hypothetical protein